jgi:hypothetical protein
MFEDTNMAVQKTMLHDSLQYLVEYYRTGVPSVHLERIRKVHSAEGVNVPPRFYDAWLDSLVQAVSEHDPQFDGRVERAWRHVMASGIAYMMEVSGKARAMRT